MTTPDVQALPPRAAVPALVRNREELLARGAAPLRRAALSIVEAAIRRGNPEVGTRLKVRRDGHRLWVDGEELDLRQVGRIWVVGAGKASVPIAAAIEDVLQDRIEGGIVVTKKGDQQQLKRIAVVAAGHPVPDADSIVGAERIVEIAKAARKGDLVFAAVTGGASALVTLPPAGVTLADLQVLNELLLRCGEPIAIINVVRRHVCLLKGGRLVQAIQPARAITLTLDTAPEGMPWPDMCLPDPSTFSDAVAVLRDCGLWDRTPESIRAHLMNGCERSDLETIKDFSGMSARTVFVGDPVSVCDAAATRAAELGFAPVVLGTFIDGEARDVAIAMAGVAREVLERSRPFAPPCALISGGETTVTIAGQGGRGGPNQEFALAFAAKMGARSAYACASLDTDGTDGPTDLAGGLTDHTTMLRASEAGVEVADALRRHASSEALEPLGDAVLTGHTGTNLQNIRVVVLARNSERPV